ncbi:MAG: tRNA-dihydrouridine synthase, partial [bacterium]|nr:tRNA-dihydrouridine synthase [bacterium]
HGRYFEQGFSGESDFAELKKIKKIVGSIIVSANGGSKDYISGKIMLEKTKSDGLMIGQGSFGKPWVFGEIKQKLVKTPPNHPLVRGGITHTIGKGESIKKIALKHPKLMVKIKGEER